MDLHRHARGSCRAPTSASPRSPAGASAASLAGHDHADRRARRDGRRAAARGHDERRRRAVRRGRSRAHRSAGSRRATSTRRPTTSTTRSRAAARRKRRAARAERRARAATPPTSLPAAARAAASRPTSSPTRRSAHDPLDGYVPADLTLAEADRAARARPRRVRAPLARVDGRPLRGDGRLPGRAAPRSSTTATACAPRPQLGGFERAFDYPGFVPAYIRPLFCEGKGPFRWVALSGDPADIAATDRAVLEEFPDDERARPLDPAGRRAGRVPGPAGADLLARLRRAPRGSGCASTRWSRSGELQAPIVIGRDHLDSGSVASPYRETEAMADGSDAIADWPLLNALVNTASRRDLGVASTTAAASASGARSTPGMVCVADGTDARRREARAGAHHRPRDGRDPPRRRRLRRARSRSPRERGVRIPMAARRSDRPRRSRRSAHPVLRERAREVDARGAGVARGAAADRRHDRHDARRQRRRHRRQPGRRAAADRGDRGRAGQPALPVQAADPADGDRQPGASSRSTTSWSTINEGCLSVPNLRGDGRRAT